MHLMRARSSLPELRNKTDRQLIVLANREIERAVDLARGGALAEAEAKCVQARTLLNVARAPDWERYEIEGRLGQAHAAIARARSAPMTFTQTACG